MMDKHKRDRAPLLCDQARTSELLNFSQLVEAIAEAVMALAQGEILSPERQVLPMGEGGVMLSMPATARDIGIHKLVNVQPANSRIGLPVIHGCVSVCDASTGALRLVLDGPEVTGRRTAAVTLLAMRTLLERAPNNILLIGTGTQAYYHTLAMQALYPEATLWIKSRSLDRARDFCAAHQAQHPALEVHTKTAAVEPDVVITVTTSSSPIYDEAPSSGRLVIAVGAFKPDMVEIGRRTLAGSQLVVDEAHGAKVEAGDFIQAGVDWSKVIPLHQALQGKVAKDRPVVFKSVGTGAWDLAAARVAVANLDGC